MIQGFAVNEPERLPRMTEGFTVNRAPMEDLPAMRQTTLGEDRVRLTSNPDHRVGVVNDIKTKTAELIDLCERLLDKPGGRDMETARLIAIAETRYEEAAMWAVKAATA